MSLTLPESLRRFVEAQVVEGGHASADAYLLALLEDARKRRGMQTLVAKLDEALESGPSELMTRENWKALERKVWERHRGKSINS